MKLKPDLVSKEILIVYVCLVTASVISAFIFTALYPFFPHVPIQTVPLIVERSGGQDYNTLVWAKPVERFTFLSLMCFLPLLTLFFVLMMDRHNIVLSRLKLFRSKIARVFITLCLIGTLIFPLYNSSFTSELFALSKNGPWWISTALIFIAAYFIGRAACVRQVNHFRSWQRDPESKRILYRMIWIIFILAMCLDIVAFRLFNINNVSLMSPVSVHFDAAIYALSQVINGKTLLVDLPSQYGLFPEILAPLFRMIGATIKSITAVFALLQIISTCALFFVLRKFVRTSWLLLLSAGLALILTTFSTPLYLLVSGEPYFQYWPIRFFWPSLSVLAFYFFAEKKSIGRALCVSFLGAVGTFWNVDSGIFIILAFGIFLGTRWIFSLYEKKNTERWLQLIGLHIVVTLAVLASLFYYLKLKSQSSLNFEWLFEYQKTFYQMGFMALPLPSRLHPWISVLGIYLLGFIYSLYSWIYHTNRKCSDIIFYLSFLGLGLFTYYEGRAHDNNLIQVFWPALMVLVLITNQIIRGLQMKRLPRMYTHLAAAGLGFFLICSVVFIINSKTFYKTAFEIANEAVTSKEHLTPLIHNELNFIKEHSMSVSECLILSKRSSLYYVEAQLASPVKGPGLIEMVLQSDQDKLMNAIATQHLDCIFFGIGESETYANIDLKVLLQNYAIIDKNTAGTMLFLRPKAYKR